MMRGTDKASGSLFSYVDLEARIPARHPLRKIRQVVNGALPDREPVTVAAWLRRHPQIEIVARDRNGG